MTVETPQPRDRVRWRRTSVIEGVVEETGADGIVVRDADGYKHLCQVDDATIEVLERADDPSENPVGTVRADSGESCVKVRPNLWFAVSGGDGDPIPLRDRHVGKWPVIGAVPGTPAAEADPETQLREAVKQMPQVGESVEQWQERTAHRSVRVENTPDGPALDVHQQASERLIAGDLPGAFGVLVTIGGCDSGSARSYLEQMSEYQTYLERYVHNQGGATS